jgi:type I restriction enzyme R subunit
MRAEAWGAAVGANPSRWACSSASWWGLDRGEAKAAFAEYLDEQRMNSAQIQFVNLLIDYFTQNGVMAPERLTQPPFASGLFGLFQPQQITDLARRIRAINANAEAVNDEAGGAVLMAAEGKGAY